MKTKAVVLSIILFFSHVLLLREAYAEDIVLQGQLQNGYYISDGNVSTQGVCTVENNGYIWIVAQGTITLNPGFSVQTGSIFGTVIGEPINLPPGLDYDLNTMPDGCELQYFGALGQSPAADPDSDTLTNLEECQIGANPTVYNTDNDADGLPDRWEIDYFGNIAQLPGADPDGDTLTNLEEYQIGSDPNSHNTDNDADGLPDRWELDHFGDLAQGPQGDFDGDGYTNYAEFITESDPSNSSIKPNPGLFYEYDAVGRIKRIIRIRPQ